MEDYGAVAPAGTSSHKALTVLADEWELTPVAMFVTSSYGHILPKELANTGLLPPTKILASVFDGSFCIRANAPMHQCKEVAPKWTCWREGFEHLSIEKHLRNPICICQTFEIQNSKV